MPILNKLKAFITTEKAFLKNISTMFGGKMYVAILGVLITPILARLFTPADYGEYALFYATVQHLVIIGTLSLPIAVSTSKNKEIASTFNLALVSILLFGAISPIILYLSAPWLGQYFNTTVFSSYWPLITASYLLSALLVLLTALNVRLSRFKQNTMANVGETTSSKLTNLGTGWFAFGSFGLIIGDLVGKLVTLGVLFSTFPKEIKFALPSLKKAVIQLKSLSHFPTFILPSEWIGLLNNQLMVLVVAFLFSKNELGQLVMAIALLSIPLNILTNTFQPVITERLTSYKDSYKIKPFFTQTALLLILISIVVFGLILLIPNQAFAFLLGNQWAGIGSIINTLAILYFFLLIDRSFENAFIVLNKQKATLIFSLIELTGQTTVLAIAFNHSLPLLTVLLLIAITRSLVSSSRMLFIWRSIVGAL